MSNMFDESVLVHENGLALVDDWGYVHLSTSAKLEAMHYANFGLNVIVPDRFIPRMELEPLTEDDIKQMAHKAYWYKRANISKFRSIIRKCHNTLKEKTSIRM